MKLNIQLFADGRVVIEADLNTKGFDRQIAKLEFELDELEETYKLALKDPDFDPKALLQLENDIEKVQNKIIGLKEQQIKLNQVSKSYGDTLKSGLHSLTKMGLAIFSIRSAYMLIRQATSLIAQDNDSIASKLSTIKNAIANLLAPLVEYLVNLAYKLLAYLNVITKTFLGIDLFKKTAKSAKSAVGSAQKLKKTLAGFDEMNILNDMTSGGGGGSSATPEIVPPKVDTKWLEDYVKKIKKAMEDIKKISLKEAFETFASDNSILKYVKLGLFWIAQGVTKVFDGILKLFKGDFKEGFVEILEGLGTIILGSITTFAGVIYAKLRIILKVIKELLLTIGDFIMSPIQSALKTAKDAFTKFKNAVGDVVKGIGKLFTGDLKGAINSFKSAFSNVMSGLWSIAKGPLNVIISGINAVIRGLNRISVEIPSWVPAYGGKKIGFNISQIPRLAQGGIINMPGRGVAIGGERGQEGVIPLTDSQQMALLGEAIGKYITINANITNTMNGRVISRELQKIQQENSFANNW